MHTRAPPEQRGSLSWPQEPASDRSKVEDFHFQPPGRRVAALVAEASRWSQQRYEAERRSRLACVGRAAVAAAAFAASGGSLVAPVLASLGVVSEFRPKE